MIENILSNAFLFSRPVEQAGGRHSIRWVYIAACMFLSFVCVIDSHAMDYTWNGLTTSWLKTTNWTPNGVPGAGDTVTFNIGSQNCTVPADTTVAGFTMSGNYTGTVTQSGTFTVAGNFNLSSGTYDYKNVILNVGRNFSHTGGKRSENSNSFLNLTGTGTLDLSGGEWTGCNLSCAAAGQTTAHIGNIRASGILTIGTGTFEAGGVLLYRHEPPLIVIKGTIKGGYVSYMPEKCTVEPGNYSDLVISSQSNVLGGNITCNNLSISDKASGLAASLDTKGYTIKANYISISGNSKGSYGYIKCNTSDVIVSENVCLHAGGTIDGDSSHWYIGGNFTNNGTLISGTSKIGYRRVISQAADVVIGTPVTGEDGKTFRWIIPSDVWTDTKGKVYVLDSHGDTHEVWAIAEGKVSKQIIKFSNAAGSFATGDTDPEGKHWLASSNGIELFSANGNSLGTWKPMDPIPENTKRIFFDHAGGIYAWVPDGEGLIAYDRSGRRKWSIQRVSDEPSELNGISSIARCSNGDIYVSEAWDGNHRVSILTANGKSKGRIPWPLCRARGMTLDNAGNLYVLTDLTTQIESPLITVFNEKNELISWLVSLKRINMPAGVIACGYVHPYLKPPEQQKLPPEAINPLIASVASGQSLYFLNGKTGELLVMPAHAFDPKVSKPTEQIRFIQFKEEVIHKNKFDYTIDLRGTLDSAITYCTGINGVEWPRSFFEPDLSYTISNTGSVPVKNPRIYLEGQPDFYSLETMLKWIVPRSNMTDEEKAFSVWDFVRKYAGWVGAGDGMRACYWPFGHWGISHPYITVTEKFNGYGAPGACGDWSAYVCRFARDAGLKSQQASVSHHVASFVWYEGQDHYFESIGSVIAGWSPHFGSFCLQPDNKSISGYKDIIRDPWLMHRMGDLGSCSFTTPHHPEVFSNPEKHTFFSKPDDPCLNGYLGWKDNSNLGIVLRPGEKITRRYEFLGYNGTGKSAIECIVNGEVVYDVDFSTPEAKFAVEDASNVEVREGALRLIDVAKPGSFVLRTRSPTPLLIARGTLAGVRKKAEDQITLSFNFDYDLPKMCKPSIKGWQTFWKSECLGEFNEPFTVTSLEEFRDYEHKGRLHPFPPRTYELQFRLSSSNSGHVEIKRFQLVSINQTSVKLLPHLNLGKNLFHYADDTDEQHEITLTHRWRESQFGKQPDVSVGPIFPENGTAVKGAEFTFCWQPPDDKGGAEIINWQFEASTRPDFAWPITPRYDRWINKAKPEMENLDPTSFRPHVTYYWRVRAMNADNIWGPWSQAWKFQCAMPGTCRNVKTKVEGRQVILSWDPPLDGTPPVKYEIYASDEPGFVPRYKPAEWIKDNGKPPTMEPANVFLTASKPQAIVVGAKLEGESANKCYFRVAAIDVNENRGCPGDFVSAPHPFIFTEPNVIAKASELYHYAPKMILSHGNMIGFPPEDMPKWSLKTAPQWIKIDPVTGVITGIPTEKGNVEVIVNVEDGHSGSAEQKFAIHVD